MGLTTRLMLIYFCILFVLYLADPSMQSGFMEFVAGDYQLNFSNIITSALTGVAGLVVATAITRDLMTGIIAAIAIFFTSWIVIPTSFLVGAPSDIRLFITVMFNLLWGMSVISFVRGYDA